MVWLSEVGLLSSGGGGVVAGMYICCCWFGKGGGLMLGLAWCPGFEQCCQVPKLVMVTVLETTVWSVNGVGMLFWPHLSNSGRCPCPVSFLQVDLPADVEWGKVTGAPIVVLILRLLVCLQVFVDSLSLGCVGGEEREVGSELTRV